jgi:hypothetical protein
MFRKFSRDKKCSEVRARAAEIRKRPISVEKRFKRG